MQCCLRRCLSQLWRKRDRGRTAMYHPLDSGRNLPGYGRIRGAAANALPTPLPCRRFMACLYKGGRCRFHSHASCRSTSAPSTRRLCIINSRPSSSLLACRYELCQPQLPLSIQQFSPPVRSMATCVPRRVGHVRSPSARRTAWRRRRPARNCWAAYGSHGECLCIRHPRRLHAACRASKLPAALQIHTTERQAM